MVLENCSICMNYWTSHGNYMTGYQYLINNQHIPEAHSTPSRPNPPATYPSGPSVSDLQTQVNNANNRANGLQNQLNAANARNATLQTQLNTANAQISSLQSQLAAANTRATDLQKQLDECRKAKKTLEGDVAQLKTDKVNLQNIINRQTTKMAKKDADASKYHKEKLAAENKIQTQLDPYITTLINIMNANGFTNYPPRP